MATTTTTTTDGRFRIVGDITVKTRAAHGAGKGPRRMDISYGSKKSANFERVSIIQARQPLTPESPYFVIEVNKCGTDKHLFCYEFVA